MAEYTRDGLVKALRKQAARFWHPGEESTRDFYTAAADLLERDQANANAPLELRPAVIWFAQWMEQKLRDNEHKGGWECTDPEDLLEHASEELEELEDAWEDIRMCTPENRELVEQNALEEAADLANMAMMVADVVSDIRKPLPTVKRRRGHGS